MWDFKLLETGKPRYLQIADALEADITSGELLPGHRLMTHRKLAQITGVTISTATRAYAEAERRGLIKTMIGKGTFVVTAASGTARESVLGTAIEMAVAMPMPLEEPSIRPVLQALFREEDVDTLVKCFAPFGYARHKKIAAGWLRRSGLDITPASLLIAAGHQHSLYSIFSTFFRHGDIIAVGQVTNPGLITLANQAGYDLKGVRMDADGMIPEELDALCRNGDVKAIYLTPGLHNMNAKPISTGRRDALAEVIAHHNLLIIEDNSYAAPEVGKATSIAALLPENSIFILSFSGVLYAGLRVSFIHAGPKFHARLARTIVENMWTVAPLCVALACECISNGMVDKAISDKRKEIARRVRLLRDTLSGFDVTCAEDSIYAWVMLPDPWSSREFEYAAEQSGVRVLAADKLSVAGMGVPNCIRLSITGPPDMPTLKRGVDILASLLRREGGVINPIW